MARGRKSQPAAVKEAKGNPGKRPIGKTQTEIADASGAAPRWLRDPNAKAVWKQLHGDLVRMKLLKATDANVFARYCQYWGEWRKLTAKLNRLGMTYDVKSQHGRYVRPRPEVGIRATTEMNLRLMETEMGLTPAARQQILQRMAIQVPPALPFGHQPDQVEPDEPGIADVGSPVGLLN